MSNIIWEDKGIILGIISHLLKHYNSLSTITLQDTRFKYIAQTLFPLLKFTTKPAKTIFNIKNNTQSHIIINNINNIHELHTSKVTLLPWYNNQNPIIMYKHNDKSIDKSKLLADIKTFNKEEREGPYDVPYALARYCHINTWDALFEYQVLDRYSKQFKYRVVDVYNFITGVLLEPSCLYEKVMPVYLPYKVPVRQDVLVPVEKVVEKVVVKEKECDNRLLGEFLNVTSKKIKAVNSMLELPRGSPEGLLK